MNALRRPNTDPQQLSEESKPDFSEFSDLLEASDGLPSKLGKFARTGLLQLTILGSMATLGYIASKLVVNENPSIPGLVGSLAIALVVALFGLTALVMAYHIYAKTSTCNACSQAKPDDGPGSIRQAGKPEVEHRGRESN